jgi:hypothetical protein
LIGVRLRADELAVGGEIPEVGAAGVEINTSERAKRANEMAGIAVLKNGPGERQKKLLESLVKLRRIAGTRISRGSCQGSPISA